MTDYDTDFTTFARCGCPDAFRRLVERHLDAVHSAAWRLMDGRADAAADVAQAAFIQLARKAALLPADLVVGSWLHRQTVRLALNMRREESRRSARERTAYELLTMNAADDSALYSAMQPYIDQAIHALPEIDQRLLTLHYFDQCQQREIAERLGFTPGAVQKRISRALVRIRKQLSKRGVTLSAATLALWFSGSAVKAAPQSLTIAISTQALRHASSASILTKLISLMTHTKAITTGAAFGLAAGGLCAAWPVAAISIEPQRSALNSSPHNTKLPLSDKFPVNTALSLSRIPVPAEGAEGLVAQLQEFTRMPDTESTRLRLNAWMFQIPLEMWDDFIRLVPTKLIEWETYNFLPVLARTWGRIDPAAAIVSLATMPHTVTNTPQSLAGNAFIAWHEADPEAAERWVVEHQADSGISKELPGFVETIAKNLKSEQSVIFWASQLGADLQRAALAPLISAIATKPNVGAPRLCSLFLEHENVAFSRVGLQTVLNYWIHDVADPKMWPATTDAVNAWLEGLPQGVQSRIANEQVLQRIATAPGQPAPQSALKFLDTQSHQENESLARQLILESDRLNPTAREWLLPLLTGADRDKLIFHAARHVSQAIQGSWNSPAGTQGSAIEWAAELADPGTRDPLIYGLFQSWLQYADDRKPKVDHISLWQQQAVLTDAVKSLIERAHRDFISNSAHLKP